MTCTKDDLIKFITSRRSIRSFKPDPVPDEAIKELIDVARYAPSAHNSQPWKFVIVRDPEKLEALANLHGGAKVIRRTKQAVVVFADTRASPTSYLVDAANAALYFQLAAHAAGLGTVWVQSLGHVEEIRRILGAPKDTVPVGIFPIGYPAESPRPRPRKPVEEITCIDKYC